jgi:hypothetical protein
MSPTFLHSFTPDFDPAGQLLAQAAIPLALQQYNAMIL